MIRKAIIGTGVLLLGLLFVGRDLASYVRTSAGYVKDSVADCVPTEFQIERARGMIDGLVPEIKRGMHKIAKEEVAVEQFEKQIADARAKLKHDEAELVRLRTDLVSGKDVFEYGHRTYSPEQVQLDLARRFERYKTNEATVASLEETYQARQTGLEAARQRLEGIRAEKRQLEVDVENIQARLQMVAAAQTTADYNFDDSRLGRVKELIVELRTDLDVAERLVNADSFYPDEIPLDEPPEDIVEQVAEHFGLHSPAAEHLAID